MRNHLDNLVRGSAVVAILGAVACGKVVVSDPDAHDANRNLDAAGLDDATGSGRDATEQCEDGFTGEGCNDCTVFVAALDGDDGSTGLSWNEALATVGAGIERAVNRQALEGLDACSVWVRKGVYVPGTNRTNSFELSPGVHLLGGFAGQEELLEERDWERHETILSGDLEQNDAADDDETLSDNAFHVLKGADGAILDGVIVTAGTADGDDVEDRHGGGMLNKDTSPTIVNTTFANNQALFGGGALRNEGSSEPHLEHVAFEDNSASSGGAISNADSSSPLLTDVIFVDNDAESKGGAVFSGRGTSPVFTNALFVNNNGGIEGGAVASKDSAAEFSNASFSGNLAGDHGGAIDGSIKRLTNCTFSNNTSLFRGGAISVRGEVVTEINNSIFWGNEASEDEFSEIEIASGSAATISHSIVLGGPPEGAEAVEVKDEDPQFRDPPEDLRLKGSSTAIDSGDSSTIDDGNLPDTDLEGEPRIVDGNGDDNPEIDMGAYEFQP